MTIVEERGRKPTVGYKSRHKTDKNTPLGDWLVGLELEMENFPMRADYAEFGGFLFTTDGSLRNDGVEAVTKPVAIKHLQGLLEAFFTHYNINQTNYSERCSTHVHFNIEPMEWENIASLCLLYQTVETLLFKFTGDDRDSNIFCVPWNQSSLSYNIVYNMQQNGPSAFRRWQKYSALNLLPIHNLGTVEFRHLGGTCDVKKIMQWVFLLAKMFEYVLSTPYEEVKNEIKCMNTVSNYHEWLERVFGEYMELVQYDGYELDLAQGVIESKLQIVSEGKVEVKTAPERLAEDFIAQVQAENLRRVQEALEAEDLLEELADPPPLRRPVNPVAQINPGIDRHEAVGNFTPVVNLTQNVAVGSRTTYGENTYEWTGVNWRII